MKSTKRREPSVQRQLGKHFLCSKRTQELQLLVQCALSWIYDHFPTLFWQFWQRSIFPYNCVFLWSRSKPFYFISTAPKHLVFFAVILFKNISAWYCFVTYKSQPSFWFSEVAVAQRDLSFKNVSLTVAFEAYKSEWYSPIFPLFWKKRVTGIFLKLTQYKNLQKFFKQLIISSSSLESQGIYHFTNSNQN